MKRESWPPFGDLGYFTIPGARRTLSHPATFQKGRASFTLPPSAIVRSSIRWGYGLPYPQLTVRLVQEGRQALPLQPRPLHPRTVSARSISVSGSSCQRAGFLSNVVANLLQLTHATDDVFEEIFLQQMPSGASLKAIHRNRRNRLERANDSPIDGVRVLFSVPTACGPFWMTAAPVANACEGSSPVPGITKIACRWLGISRKASRARVGKRCGSMSQTS